LHERNLGNNLQNHKHICKSQILQGVSHVLSIDIYGVSMHTGQKFAGLGEVAYELNVCTTSASGGDLSTRETPAVP